MSGTAILAALLLTGAGAAQAPPPHSAMPLPFRPPPPPPQSPVIPAQRMRANLNTYFAAGDYPASALRARQEGTVSVRLQLNDAGRVTGCQVTATSGSPALDAATCRILRSRARYRPAQDRRTGRTMPSLDSGRITWRLPTR